MNLNKKKKTRHRWGRYGKQSSNYQLVLQNKTQIIKTKIKLNRLKKIIIIITLIKSVLIKKRRNQIKNKF